MSNGDLYTVLTNRAGRGRKGSIVAIVDGVDSTGKNIFQGKGREDTHPFPLME